MNKITPFTYVLQLIKPNNALKYSSLTHTCVKPSLTQVKLVVKLGCSKPSCGNL